MTKIAPRVICPSLLCLLFLLDACSKETRTLEERLAAVDPHAQAVMEAVRQRWAPNRDIDGSMNDLGREFDLQLEAIECATDSALLQQAHENECCDVRYKLISLADYRENNEERIGEITEHFFRAKWAREHVLPPPPMMSADWARASDRLAWEYLLLRPSAANVPNEPFFGERAISALIWIGDPKSVQTIGLNIQAALTKTAIAEHRNRYLTTMIRGLAGIPSVASLDALLDVRAWIAEAPRTERDEGLAPEFSSPEPVTAVLDKPAEFLKMVLRDDTRQRWKPVLEEFARVASPERKAALARLLSMSVEDVFGRSAREP